MLNNFVPRPFADYLKEVLNTLRTKDKLEDTGRSLRVYGDPAFDALAMMSAPMLSGVIGKTLTPTYTSAKIYLNDADLLPHLDKEDCKHTVTLFLGGDYTHIWPIWMKKPDKHQTPELCALSEGDAVIYRGSEVHHWRDHFEGSEYFQLSMHYTDNETGETKQDDGHTGDQ